ncbi:hypothetical protein D3C87_1289650 [compost metagenome]
MADDGVGDRERKEGERQVRELGAREGDAEEHGEVDCHGGAEAEERAPEDHAGLRTLEGGAGLAEVRPNRGRRDGRHGQRGVEREDQVGHQELLGDEVLGDHVDGDQRSEGVIQGADPRPALQDGKAARHQERQVQRERPNQREGDGMREEREPIGRGGVEVAQGEGREDHAEEQVGAGRRIPGLDDRDEGPQEEVEEAHEPEGTPDPDQIPDGELLGRDLHLDGLRHAGEARALELVGDGGADGLGGRVAVEHLAGGDGDAVHRHDVISDLHSSLDSAPAQGVEGVRALVLEDHEAGEGPVEPACRQDHANGTVNRHHGDGDPEDGLL